MTLVDETGRQIKGTVRQIRFAGRAGITVPAGSPWLSDVIDVQLPPRARLRIDIFLPAETGLCTCHPVGGQTASISTARDFVGREFMPSATFAARAFVSAVETTSTTRAPLALAFGDSITDGFMSTIDRDAR